MPRSSKRRVKIVCTIGPASRSEERLVQLIQEGMDVARLNFSHGDHAFHLQTIQTLRLASKTTGKHVAILQDLQGPKIRAGQLPKGGIELAVKQRVLLYPEGSTPQLISTTSPDHPVTLLPISAEIAKPVSKDVRKGHRILFDDGKLATIVLEVKSPEILVEVEVGGTLTSHKGMNLPDTPLSIPCLTDKDIEDLAFGLQNQVDAVALSFVRSAADIENLRKHIKRLTPDYMPLIVAKIERPEAVENQDSIVESSDIILVARGDMAVEVGAERVPTIQKNLIRACNELGVPVITATQMLESMISCPTPTRAEASDVANAVYDGTDAVMLSAETASGQYPRESVRTMVRIILEAERWPERVSRGQEILPLAGSTVESIEFSASRIAHHVGAAAIACITHSGTAARTLAKFRPSTPIVAILENEAILRRLAFVWGLQGILIPEIGGTDDLFTRLEKVLIENEWANAEDIVVVTAGIPTLRRGTTNMIKVHRIALARR